MESRAAIDRVLAEVSAIVSKMAGIQLGTKQASMVENRLKSRMLRLNIETFSEYLDYLNQHLEAESQSLLSLLTTHHTYFFREFNHFEFLLNKGLDQLIDKARSRSDKTIRIWSAACSRGQEAYSLAMFFDFHLKASAPDVQFEIWGTDVDPESVRHAQNGVFKAEELKKSPAMYLNEQWIRGKGDVREFSKVKDTLKRRCRFETANLLNLGPFLSGKTFDVIFCRNVFIYFNQDQIQSCTKQMLRHLEPSGLLFLGVSESLNGLGLDVKASGPSVYQHATVEKMQKAPKPVVSSTVKATPARPLEILCVDDSATILALLKKILSAESGFVVKATAANGREGLEKLKAQKFDLITLDLHMPELDGIGFLKASQGPNRPPVVVVSSINRDDPSIAKMALELGAADYVEKPSLENLSQAGNEIRSKLKMVWGMRSLIKPESASASSSEKQAPSLKSEQERKIKVLVVDDSLTIRNLIKQIISKDKSLEVCAEAERPSQVDELIRQHKPDVITLDINMPEMDGVTLLKKIQPKYGIPTIMISSISREEGDQVLGALANGAIDYIQKPQMNEIEETARLIREKIKIAANAKPQKVLRAARRLAASAGLDHHTIIALGASTGGTEALRVVLESLPANIPPILIVQHIPPVFSAAFAARLDGLCQFKVAEAKDGDEIVANQVLIAPGGKQMGVRSQGGKLFAVVNQDSPMNRHRPSVDYLFQSIANSGLKRVVAGIFTGMGADGAKMMRRLRDQGARTIAQNQETCVVYGMPREAIEAGAAEFTLPLESIAQKILDLSTAEAKPKKIAS